MKTFAILFLVSTMGSALHAAQLDFYSESTTDSKSDNAVMFNRMHLNFAQTSLLNKAANLYAGGGFSTDERSESQSVYNDNYTYLTAGGRWSLLPSISVFAEMREVVSEPDYAEAKSNHDFRTGAFSYFRQDLVKRPLFHEHYSELIFSNRQNQNVLGFGRTRAGFVAALTNNLQAEALLEGQLRLDRIGNYYDNRIDVGPKARLKLMFEKISIDLSGGYVRGYYLGRTDIDPLPQDRSYGNWQALLALFGGF